MRQTLTRLSDAMTRVMVPGTRYHQDIWVDELERYIPRGGTWLDLGCGHQLLPRWHAHREGDFVGRAWRVHGIDYALESLRKHRSIRSRTRGDIASLPYRAGTFDLVSANMVVEHLARPAEQFREVARVLKPGGRFLFHTPNRRNYQVQLAGLVPEGLKARLAELIEDRPAEDVFPTFYRANSDVALRELAAASGLEVERLDHITTIPGLALVPPLALVELVWIRALQHESLESLRHNIIGVLRKPA